MTPTEWQQMIGMWATVPSERRPVIITGAEGYTVRWIDPGHPQRWGMTPVSLIVPLLDLPRAWTPSGEPVPGEWEESPSAEHFHRWCARWEKKPDEVTP